MTLGSGDLGAGCHPQAVTVGNASVAKQGFNPNLPSWCLSESLGVATSVFSPTEWAPHVSTALALFSPGELMRLRGKGWGGTRKFTRECACVYAFPWHRRWGGEGLGQAGWCPGGGE